MLARRFLFSRAIARADIIGSLYLSEIKAYKPTTTADKSGLATTFSVPKPPAVPGLEGVGAVLKASEESALEEDAWPALVDPIDDPANYNGESF
jgi:hypothetical protein